MYIVYSVFQRINTINFMNEEAKNKSRDDKKNKKEKNLIALVILLAGFFLGSLFVDMSQLIKGGGISQKILSNKDVFNLNGKTWVAYSDPIVDVTIVNDDDCEECNIDEALVWFRKIIPTILAHKVDYNSAEGEELIDEFGVKSLPVFVFGKEIEDTEFYAQAQPLFTQKNEKYILDAVKLGLPAGKYVDTPSINDDSIKVGPDDAKVKLIEFSDFQCPYCQAFHKIIGEVISTYGDDVQLVFKNLPLESIHPRAKDAALAAECANEQGKFIEYADKLFANQKSWGETTGTKSFSNYAFQIGLNGKDFNSCLADEKYKDRVEADVQEADEFGIAGTPALFIDDVFKSGVVQLDELKEAIDEKLAGDSEESGEESMNESSDESEEGSGENSAEEGAQE